MFRRRTNRSIRAVVWPEGDKCRRPSWHRWRPPGMGSPNSLRRKPRRCLVSSYCHHPPGDRTAPHRRHAYVRAIPCRVKEMVTVVTIMRLLTVAGMRQYMLPSSCPTVVGSCNRKYPFRICVNFSEQLPNGRRQLESEVSFSDMRQFFRAVARRSSAAGAGSILFGYASNFLICVGMNIRCHAHYGPV